MWTPYTVQILTSGFPSYRNVLCVAADAIVHQTSLDLFLTSGFPSYHNAPRVVAAAYAVVHQTSFDLYLTSGFPSNHDAHRVASAADAVEGVARPQLLVEAR